MLRNLLIGVSTNPMAESFVTHFPVAKSMAGRFIAGKTLDDGVAAVQYLNDQGIKGLMNEVGEAVNTREEVTEAVAVFKVMLDRIAAEGLDSSVSLKPSHLGMTFGKEFFFEKTEEIVAYAAQYNNRVEIDIEGSDDVDDTLDVFHRLMDLHGNQVGVALQGYLYRTPDDTQKIIDRGGAIRLVKGAYKEPPDIAIQDKHEINQAMIEIMEMMLTPAALEKGAYLALGSHDSVLIDWLTNTAEARQIPKDRFEFQMLQGIRRGEQQRLAQAGYRVRIYVPFGSAWYPYFMRRLAERPANLLFFARAALGD